MYNPGSANASGAGVNGWRGASGVKLPLPAGQRTDLTVFLKAGEMQTVELEVKIADLAFYNEKHQSWTVEPGEFILRNASSSAEVKNSVSVIIVLIFFI